MTKNIKNINKIKNKNKNKNKNLNINSQVERSNNHSKDFKKSQSLALEFKEIKSNIGTSCNNSYALVTGASSGIGYATAIELAVMGYNLVLVARRTSMLKKLKSEIQTMINSSIDIQLVTLDLTNRKKIDLWAKNFSTSKTFTHLKILVNNAGLAAGVDKVDTAKTSDWDLMLETNVRSLMWMTRQMLPSLIANKGHIINLGSVAGRWVYPGGAVYCATKFAVRAFSEGLRQDLLGKQVRITNIEPGMVETEFSEVRLKNKAMAKQVYQDMQPLTGKDIATTIAWCLQQPAHVNIQELVVFPTDQAAVGQVHRNSIKK